MNKFMWVAGACAAALLPTAAMAQDRCAQQQHDRQVAGTVIGAVAGAVIGNQVAGRNDRTTGTVAGAVVGGVAGNYIARSTADCDRAYGYYDRNGLWHANDRNVDHASGYFDRDGRFIEGRPNGYYADDGRWYESRDDGYMDRDGRWVPASSTGYYNSRGEWMAGTASGYYANGRWVAGPTRGYYDSRGTWIRGDAPGRFNASGVWVADAQPGYYDDGRWVPGETRGYYDTRGQWVSYRGYTQTSMGERDRDDRGDMWRGVGAGTREREQFLERRIRLMQSQGTLSRREGAAAYRELQEIKRFDSNMRRQNGGRLSAMNSRAVNARLDRLARTVRMDARDDDRRPGGERN